MLTLCLAGLVFFFFGGGEMSMVYWKVWLSPRSKEKERHEQAKELGLCRTCRSPAMPGRTRCQDCIEKRRLRQIQAREKAIQQKQGTLDQPPLF